MRFDKLLNFILEQLEPFEDEYGYDSEGEGEQPDYTPIDFTKFFTFNERDQKLIDLFTKPPFNFTSLPIEQLRTKTLGKHNNHESIILAYRKVPLGMFSKDKKVHKYNEFLKTGKFFLKKKEAAMDWDHTEEKWVICEYPDYTIDSLTDTDEDTFEKLEIGNLRTTSSRIAFDFIEWCQKAPQNPIIESFEKLNKLEDEYYKEFRDAGVDDDDTDTISGMI